MPDPHTSKNMKIWQIFGRHYYTKTQYTDVSWHSCKTEVYI